MRRTRTLKCKIPINVSRNAKIALLVIGALAVICLGICGIGIVVLPRVAGNLISQKPADAKKVGAEIADYTFPEGYTELMGMNFLVYKMVMIAPAGQGSLRDGMGFMLMGTNMTGISQAEMERQMQQSFQQQYGSPGSRMTVVGQESVTIRGQDVNLTITESDGGTKARQALGTFQGKNGLVVVMAIGSASNWDDALLRQFLGSIQ